MDDENEGNNGERNLPFEEDGAIRRNQVLIFGVVLLGILAICLAVSMPSDLDLHEAELPSPAVPIATDVVDDRPSSIPPTDPSKRNQTNSTTRPKTLRNGEVPVEVKLLRDMAIQKKIQEYYDSGNSNNKKNRASITASSDERFIAVGNNQQDTETGDIVRRAKEELESIKVNNIVETFVNSADFEDFLIDIEIRDAVKRLKEERGYKGKPTTIFDELFKRAEKEFIGEDEEELKLIKRVGEELEKRARDVISKRKEGREEELSEPEKMLASELLKSEFSNGGSGGDSIEHFESGEEGEIIEIQKTEL